MAPKLPGNQHVCLFYYLRHQRRGNSSTDKKTTLLAVDEEGLILKWREERAKSYVLIGNVKGTCSFVKPMRKEVSQDKFSQMNLHEMNLLFNGMKINEQEEAKEKEKDPMEIWSDSEDSHGSHNERPVSSMLNESRDESDHGDDPLRNLYTKMLSKK